MQFINGLLSGVSSGLIYGLIALAIVLVWRSSRAVNFAQAGQAMFSTFVALSIYEKTGNYAIALVVALVAGAIIGGITYLIIARTLRTQGSSAALIASLGALVLFESGAGMIWGADLRIFQAPLSMDGIAVGNTILSFSPYDVFVVVSAGLLVLLTSLLFNKTRIGLAMRAASLNAEVAQISGVQVQRMLFLGWIIAGVLGGMAGVLIGPLLFLTPSAFAIVLIFAFTAAVVGGLDSPPGAILGGLSTGVVLSLVTAYSDASNAPLVALGVLALTLLIHPQGLLGGRVGRQV